VDADEREPVWFSSGRGGNEADAPEAHSPPMRPMVFIPPVVLACLVAVILAVTVAGVIRILSLPAPDAGEAKAWAAIVVLLVGLILATVVGTCAMVIKHLAVLPDSKPPAQLVEQRPALTTERPETP
jgi:hypothetical protein